MPFNFWGKVKRSLGGIDLSARVAGSSNDVNELGVQLEASTFATAVQLDGSANLGSKTGAISAVKVSQKLDALGGRLTVAPRYSIDKNKPDMKVSYGVQGTTLTFDMSPDSQKVTVAQAIGSGKLTPAISTAGDLELEYSRPFMAGMLSASYKPDSHVGLKWAEGPWVANVNAPMSGLYKFTNGVKFNVRRIVDTP